MQNCSEGALLAGILAKSGSGSYQASSAAGTSLVAVECRFGVCRDRRKRETRRAMARDGPETRDATTVRLVRGQLRPARPLHSGLSDSIGSGSLRPAPDGPIHACLIPSFITSASHPVLTPQLSCEPEGYVAFFGVGVGLSSDAAIRRSRRVLRSSRGSWRTLPDDLPTCRSLSLSAGRNERQDASWRIERRSPTTNGLTSNGHSCSLAHT